MLPADVEQERIQARFEHGILYLAVPKNERARRRWIEVQDGNGQRRLAA